MYMIIKAVLISISLVVLIGILYIPISVWQQESFRTPMPSGKVVKDDFQWRGLWKDPWNYTFKTKFNTGFLRVYPEQGTGITVDISKKFDFDIFNSFCRSSGNLRAILPIYSSANRADTRNILRDTLGKRALQLNCKIFFIVGISLNENVNSRVQKEFVDRKDLLMVGKIDTYRDLNNKAMAMLTWISHHCINVSYIIHLIDDAFINLPAILKHLDGIRNVNYATGLKIQSKAITDKKFKTFVTKEEYPYADFPVYVYGFAYAFPRHVNELLLSVAHTATYCWIEDVWLMGHVRIAANITVIPTSKYVIRHNIKPQQFKRLYSSV